MSLCGDLGDAMRRELPEANRRREKFSREARFADPDHPGSCMVEGIGTEFGTGRGRLG